MSPAVKKTMAIAIIATWLPVGGMLWNCAAVPRLFDTVVKDRSVLF
jgi:hypothetical protein